MKPMRLMSMVAALALVACSSNEPAAEPAPATPQAPAASAVTGLDPVGMYDFVATMGIETRTGTLEITRNAEGGLRGEGWLEGESEPAVIESGAVSGQHVQLTAFVGGGNQVTFELDFEGTGFSGVITAGGQTIEVDGTRRAQ